MMLSFRATIATCLVACLTLACDRPGDAKNSNVAKSPGVLRIESALERFAAQRGELPKIDDPVLKQAMSALVLGNSTRAREVCDEFLAKDPNNPRALYIRAFSNHRQKLYAAARPDFERVIDAGPVFDNAKGAFIYYAWTCYYLGDLDTSAAAFQAASKLGLDEADTQYGLGLIALERGDLDEAEKHLRDSNRLAKDALVNLAKQGKAPRQSDRTDFGKTEVRLGGLLLQRSELDPSKSDALLKEARILLEDATKYVAWSEDCWFNLSRVYHRLGELDLEKAALEEIKKGRAKHGAPSMSGNRPEGD